ncbi:MAG: DinB family protein [Gemmatimonadaceae bacterium]
MARRDGRTQNVKPVHDPRPPRPRGACGLDPARPVYPVAKSEQPPSDVRSFRTPPRESGESLSGLLDEFGRLRAENLATLAAWRLTDAKLALDGEHPEFGTVTLRQLLATWVVHDLGHIAQTARVMAKQYRDAIGPWRAYLPIVD